MHTDKLESLLLRRLVNRRLIISTTKLDISICRRLRNLQCAS